MHGIVEKPKPEDAPSTWGVMGRYVFTPAIFESIDRTKPGAGGEIQLTDAIGGLLPELDVYGYTFDEGRYDIGSKLDYLRATVELALAREDLGPEFRAVAQRLRPRARHRLTRRRADPARRGRAGARAASGSAPLEPAVRTWTVAAVGCVLAEAVTSPEDVPPFANTAMDGYAVRAADTAGRAPRRRRSCCRWSPRWRRATRPTGRCSPARRCGSSPARRCPTAPTPS